MNTISKIKKNSGDYPPKLLNIKGFKAPESIQYMGNPEILKNKKTAVFCSSACPPGLIVKALDLAGDMRKQGITAMGGFHSPVEREMLNILLGGKQPVILCSARSLENMRIKREYRDALKKERLLILSPFEAGTHRITSETSLIRNRFVAALADKIIIIYASPGGKLEGLLSELSAFQKPVLILEGNSNYSIENGGKKDNVDYSFDQ